MAIARPAKTRHGIHKAEHQHEKALVIDAEKTARGYRITIKGEPRHLINHR